MKAFFYRNKHKIIIVFVLALVLVGLTSCRLDASSWYSKPYTTYAKEWVDLWKNGNNVFNALLGWPVTILSWPIGWLCSNIGKGLGNSYFWGIFFTTLIVRTCAWPIYATQNSSQLKMQLMQPEMSKIQRKYAGRQDQASQQAMQQEMMKLYKKYKINPAGCVITMVMQFPIFMAMYEVVQRVNAKKTETLADGIVVTYPGDFALSNTKFLGFEMCYTSFLSDLTSGHFNKDMIFCLIVALAFGGLTYLQQWLAKRPTKYQKTHPNDTKGQNSQQAQQAKSMQTMMLVMNIMFIVMALNSTSLGIYWLIGAAYQILQSFIGRKINEKQYEKLSKM